MAVMMSEDNWSHRAMILVKAQSHNGKNMGPGVR